MLEDKILKCCDCGCEFVFSVSEQEYFAKKEFVDPSRCLQCRLARKQKNAGGFGRAHHQQYREMYPATCACCGVRTQVPFRPSSDRPVYCKDCYLKKQAMANKRNSFALSI